MTLSNASIVLFILVFPIVLDITGRKPIGRLHKYFLSAAVLLLLALDWAALHDIVGGKQPHYRWEYTVLAASLAVFVYLVLRRRRRSHLSVKAE